MEDTHFSPPNLIIFTGDVPFMVLFRDPIYPTNIIDTNSDLVNFGGISSVNAKSSHPLTKLEFPTCLGHQKPFSYNILADGKGLHPICCAEQCTPLLAEVVSWGLVNLGNFDSDRTGGRRDGSF